MQAEWYCSEDEDNNESMQDPDCYYLDPAEREVNEMDHLLDGLRTYLDQIHTYNGTTPEPVLQGRRVQAGLGEFVDSAQQTNPNGSAALDEATLTRLALVLNDSGSGVLNVLADYKNAFLALEERGNLRPIPLIRDGKGAVSRHDVADTVMAAASALLASMDRYRAAVYN